MKKTIIWMIAMILLVSTVFAAGDSFKDHILTYLPLDDNQANTNVYDPTGNLTWTASDNTNTLSDTNAVINRSFTLDATNSERATAPASLGSYSNGTVCLWINPKVVDGEYWSYDTQTGNDYMTIRRNPADNEYGVIIVTGGVSRLNDGCNVVMQKIDSWNHICVTQNTTSTGCYYNGTIVASWANTYWWDNIGNTNMAVGSMDSGDHPNGSVDEVGVWSQPLNATDISALFNSGEGLSWDNFTDPAPPAPTYTSINISSPLPEDNTQYAYSTLNFNASVNSTLQNFNCSLVLNGTVNQTEAYTLGSEVYVNFTTTMQDGDYHFSINCTSWDGNYTTSGNNTFYVDTNDPIITTNFLNASIYLENTNISSWFNFTDDIILHRYNISIDGVNIQGNVSINESSLDILFNYNVSSLSGGLHTITVEVADGHTADSLLSIYSTKNGIFNDYLEYTFKYPYNPGSIRISNKDSSIFDTWTTEKLDDRYSFYYEPSEQKTSYTFTIEAEDTIFVARRPNTDYVTWIVYDNHWMDFAPYKDIEITRISNKEVEVTISDKGIEKQEILEFHSIGDLNIVQENYSFAVIDATETYDLVVLEGEDTTFALNLTYIPGTIDDITAIFSWNNTNYTATKTVYSDTISFTKTITTFIAPGDSYTAPFRWYYNITGVAENVSGSTASKDQSVYALTLYNCSGIGTNVTLNYTIHDELTDALINAELIGTFDYGASLDNLSNTLTFDYPATNNSAVCMLPYWATIYSDYTLQYGSATLGYSYRYKQEPAAVLTNATENIKLYLLPLANTVYGRFSIVDGYNNPLEGVYVVMKNAAGVTIETETSDASGLATFSVNPATTYDFTFTKTGYPVYSTSLRIISSDILTIVLGETATTLYNDSYYSGIAYEFNPGGNLQNNTDYPFQFNLTSSDWTVTQCDLYLYDDHTLLASSAGTFTGTECNAQVNFNTNPYSSILGVAIYSLNGTVINVSNVYTISHTYSGEFSLLNFLEDIRDFGSAGFNSFTRMLIALIVILAITGISVKEGIKDPLVIGILVFVLVLAFSVLGFFTISDPNIPIPTDWIRQYLISILVGLIIGAYLIKQELY